MKKRVRKGGEGVKRREGRNREKERERERQRDTCNDSHSVLT